MGTLYLFNVKTQQSCVPHALPRDPDRGNVAVPQHLVNDSLCVRQFFTVFIADEMAGFQNSLYLSLNFFCREMKVFRLLSPADFYMSMVQDWAKKGNDVAMKCIGMLFDCVLVSADQERAYPQGPR